MKVCPECKSTDAFCNNCGILMQEKQESGVARTMAENRFGRIVELWLREILLPEFVTMQLAECRNLTGLDPVKPATNMLEALQEIRAHIETLVMHETNPKKLDASLEAIARSIQ